jgi:hypothetical protein
MPFYSLYKGEYDPSEDRLNRNYEASQLLTRYDTFSSYDLTNVTIFFLLPFFFSKKIKIK